MSYNYLPTNSSSHKIIEQDFLRDKPGMSFTQLSQQVRTLDDFVIPDLRLEKDKPTINRNISVSFMPEISNIHHKHMNQRSLIRLNSLERWTNFEIETAYEEMEKELDNLVDHLHKVEDMKSDDE